MPAVSYPPILNRKFFSWTQRRHLDRQKPAPQKSTPQLFGKPMGGPAIVLLVLLGLAFSLFFSVNRPAVPSLSADQFIHEVEADNVTNVEIIGSTIRGIFKTTPPKDRIESPEGTRRFTVEVSQYLVGDGLDSLLLKHNAAPSSSNQQMGPGFYLASIFLSLFYLWVPFGSLCDVPVIHSVALGYLGISPNLLPSDSTLKKSNRRLLTLLDSSVKEDLKEIVG